MHEIAARVRQWMDDRANNAIEPESEHPAFDTPLIGAARATDPLFGFIREDIGPDFYWRPEEAFAHAFPDDPAPAKELSVVAWVLPQTERTRKAHRKAGPLPSREWSCGRHYGEIVNEGLRRFVVGLFAERGVRACAPALLPQWSRQLSPKYSFASTWSERHTAHICGLGTFGLSDGLITPAGKAVRVGSVIVHQRLEPTPRPYTRHNEWCLHFAKGKCVACMKRCPVGAITEAGHDKEKCRAYIRGTTAPFVERDQLGIRVNSCGLCQTGTPCEHRNPTAPRTPAR
jgi:ferredoxin